jgi:hypothetical protein
MSATIEPIRLQREEERLFLVGTWPAWTEIHLSAIHDCDPRWIVQEGQRIHFTLDNATASYELHTNYEPSDIWLCRRIDQ